VPMRFVLWNWPTFPHPITRRTDVCALVGRSALMSGTDTALTMRTKYETWINARPSLPADRPHMLYVQNLGIAGNYQNAVLGPVGIMSAGADALISPAPHTPTPAAASMFTANGRAATKTFVTGLATQLASLFASKGIAIDHYADDREERPGAKVGDTWIEAWETGENRGIYEPSVNDARAATEPYVPGVTLAQVEAARIAAGISIDTGGQRYSTLNRTFLAWLWGNYDNFGWLGVDAIRDGFRTQWPALTYSNYATALGTAGNPVREYWAGWALQHASVMQADAHSDVLYAPNMAQAYHAGNIAPGETNDAYFVRFHTANRRAIASRTDNKPVFAWCSPTSANQGGSFQPSQAACAAVLQARNRMFGDETFLIWTADGGSTASLYDEALDLIQQVAGSASSRFGRNSAVARLAALGGA
jgi:hypothetical protein